MQLSSCTKRMAAFLTVSPCRRTSLAAAILNTSWYVLRAMSDVLGMESDHLSRAPAIHGKGPSGLSVRARSPSHVLGVRSCASPDDTPRPSSRGRMDAISPGRAPVRNSNLTIAAIGNAKKERVALTTATPTWSTGGRSLAMPKTARRIYPGRPIKTSRRGG